MRKVVVVISFVVVVLLGWFAGCGPESELGGAALPNRAPDTRITASPPDPSETSCTVSFAWFGNDPDGFVKGFEWRLSDNGDDGISVQDTVTVDPVSGALLHPWHYTTGPETTLVVSAPLDSFPGDPPGIVRSYQTHTFFVRSMDDAGATDPSPASISFTTTTLIPTAVVELPIASAAEPSAVAKTVGFRYDGVDADFETGRPTRVRFLFKPAVFPDGRQATSRADIVRDIDFFASFSDSSWSDWRPFAADPARRTVSFPGFPAQDPNGRRLYYLFFIQTQDTTGAVSINRRYGQNLRHFFISESAPSVSLNETYLGTRQGAGEDLLVDFDIAVGQELNFSWSASAEAYVGEIRSYRYGWDVTDPHDPFDPHWAIAPGLTSRHRMAPSRAFTSGVHTLTVEVRDNADQVARITARLNVVPVPDLVDRHSVVIVDDVYDRTSNAWPAIDGRPLDNDRYRDAFWRAALGGAGGVFDFIPGRDEFDAEVSDPSLRDIVNYRCVIWTTRWSTWPASYVARGFRTNSFDTERYNWLFNYQDTIGNVFLCASRGMDAFLKSTTQYATPIIFETTEGDAHGYSGDLRVGFGQRTAIDGTTFFAGPTRYPYTAWGIATLDFMSPTNNYVIYGSDPEVSVRTGRQSSCASTKGLIIDPDFAARYMPSGVAFAETTLASTQIEWRDLSPSYYDNLNVNYAWGNTEFYDQVITHRNTAWHAQVCPGAPGDRCVEPMFRSLARFDWIRAQHRRVDPDDTWPDGYYTVPIASLCGPYALNYDGTSAATSGLTVGFVSHRLEARKPTGVGDVMWGFDPYRFDSGEIIKAVQWVLGEHFNLPMRP